MATSEERSSLKRHGKIILDDVRILKIWRKFDRTFSKSAGTDVEKSQLQLKLLPVGIKNNVRNS